MINDAFSFWKLKFQMWLLMKCSQMDLIICPVFSAPSNTFHLSFVFISPIRNTRGCINERSASIQLQQLVKQHLKYQTECSYLDIYNKSHHMELWSPYLMIFLLILISVMNTSNNTHQRLTFPIFLITSNIYCLHVPIACTKYSRKSVKKLIDY